MTHYIYYVTFLYIHACIHYNVLYILSISELFAFIIPFISFLLLLCSALLCDSVSVTPLHHCLCLVLGAVDVLFSETTTMGEK